MRSSYVPSVGEIQENPHGKGTGKHPAGVRTQVLADLQSGGLPEEPSSWQAEEGRGGQRSAVSADRGTVALM